MPPTISILIANYNYAAFVGEAIRSCLDQAVAPHEIIVVDDGSTDDSRAVISAFDGIRAIFQENTGHVGAAVRGLAEATGDVVIFLDADDALLPNACATIANRWHPGLHALQFRLELFGRVDRTGDTLPRYPFDRGDTRAYVARTGSFVYPPTSGNAFDRDFARRVFDLSQGLVKSAFDMWLSLAAALTGRIEATDEVLGRYRIHPTNMSQPGSRRAMSWIQLDIWYAYQAQQSAFAVAQSYGVPVRRPDHLIGPYYLLWYLLLRGATINAWPIPEVPRLGAVVVGLRGLWGLRSVGLKQKLANSLMLPVLAVAPRSLRRLVATRLYGYLDDIGF